MNALLLLLAAWTLEDTVATTRDSVAYGYGTREHGVIGRSKAFLTPGNFIRNKRFADGVRPKISCEHGANANIICSTTGLFHACTEIKRFNENRISH